MVEVKVRLCAEAVRAQRGGTDLLRQDREEAERSDHGGLRHRRLDRGAHRLVQVQTRALFVQINTRQRCESRKKTARGLRPYHLCVFPASPGCPGRFTAASRCS